MKNIQQECVIKLVKGAPATDCAAMEAKMQDDQVICHDLCTCKTPDVNQNFSWEPSS